MGTANFRIRHASDDRTSVLETPVVCKHFNRDRNIDVYAQRSRNPDGKEPTIESINLNLKSTLNLTGLVKGDAKSTIFMRVGKCKYLICFRKIGNRYNVNGDFANLDIIMKAIIYCVVLKFLKMFHMLWKIVYHISSLKGKTAQYMKEVQDYR